MLRQAAELAVDFRRALDSRPQKPAKTFAEMRESFIAPLPEEGSDGRVVIEELAALAQPGLAAMSASVRTLCQRGESPRGSWSQLRNRR